MTAPEPEPLATPDITPPPAEAPAPKELPVVESPAAIAAIDDRPSELVLIPEWKSAVYVRALNGSDRDSLEAETLEQAKPGQAPKVRHQDFRAKLAVRSIVTRAGVRVFQDAEWPTLAAKSGAALDRICTVAVQLSGIGREDLERLMGESGAARPSASPTG